MDDRAGVTLYPQGVRVLFRLHGLVDRHRRAKQAFMALQLFQSGAADGARACA